MRNYILMYTSTQTYARTRLYFHISVYVHMHTDILKLSINILFASGFSDSCETTARSPSFLAADRSCPTTSPKRSRESAISWRRGNPRATPLSPALAPPPYGKCPTTSAPCSYGRLASETASPIRRITTYCRQASPSLSNEASAPEVKNWRGRRRGRPHPGPAPFREPWTNVFWRDNKNKYICRYILQIKPSA